MKILIAALLYIGTAASLFAADSNARPKDVANAKPKDVSEDKALVTKPPVDWIKTYSLSPYNEMWNLSVTVKNFDKDLPKVIKILEAQGATATVPIAQSVGSSTDKSQQLSYKLSEKAAKGAVDKLKKFDPKVSPRMTHNGELVDLAAVGEKLDKLTAERNLHRAELQAMPSIAAMADEMIQHLATVKKVRETVETQVLLNMTVREKR
jgi:hypothetical protein